MPRPIHVALNFNRQVLGAGLHGHAIGLPDDRPAAGCGFHLCHTKLQPGHAAVLDRIPAEFGATLVHHDPEANAGFRDLGRRAAVDQSLSPDHLCPPPPRQAAARRYRPGALSRLRCDGVPARRTALRYRYGGKPIAAAFDPFHLGLKKGRDISSKQTRFDTGDRYFNSGVMLIDLERYAAADLPAKVHALAKAGIGRCVL